MCAGLCPTYATALGDAKENRNGRRLSCLGVIRKTGITSLTFWLTLFLHPVSDGSIHMCQLDRGKIEPFSVRCIYDSVLIVSEI